MKKILSKVQKWGESQRNNLADHAFIIISRNWGSLRAVVYGQYGIEEIATRTKQRRHGDWTPTAILPLL